MLALFSAPAPNGDRINRIVPSQKIDGGAAANTGQGLIPDGVKELIADDDASTITINGTDAATEEMKLIFAEFDIVPRQISVKIGIQSRVDKYNSTTNTQIANNSPWTMEDGTTGLKLTVAPRMNADGTVTGSFTIGTGKKAVTLVARFKNREPIHLMVGENGSVVLQRIAAQEETWKDGKPQSTESKSQNLKTPAIDVALTFEVREEPNSGPIEPLARRVTGL